MTLTIHLGVEGGQLVLVALTLSVLVALTLSLLSLRDTMPKSTRSFFEWFTLYTTGALTAVVGVIRLLRSTQPKTLPLVFTGILP